MTETPAAESVEKWVWPVGKWLQVDRQTAQQHPLYGVNGWLWLPGIYISVQAAWAAFNCVPSALGLFTILPPGVMPFVILLLVPALIKGMVALLWWNKSPAFRGVFFLLLIAGGMFSYLGKKLYAMKIVPLAFSFGYGPGSPSDPGFALNTTDIDLLIIVILLLGFSRRYRVTFKQQVLRDDPFLTRDTPQPVPAEEKPAAA